MQARMIIEGYSLWSAPSERKGVVILKKCGKKVEYLTIRNTATGYDIRFLDSPARQVERWVRVNPYLWKHGVRDSTWKAAVTYAQAEKGDSKRAERRAKIKLDLALGQKIRMFMYAVGGHEFLLRGIFRPRIPGVLYAIRRKKRLKPFLS